MLHEIYQQQLSESKELQSLILLQDLDLLVAPSRVFLHGAQIDFQVAKAANKQQTFQHEVKVARLGFVFVCFCFVFVCLFFFFSREIKQNNIKKVQFKENIRSKRRK